jgi:hypothetical protein
MGKGKVVLSSGEVVDKDQGPLWWEWDDPWPQSEQGISVLPPWWEPWPQRGERLISWALNKGYLTEEQAEEFRERWIKTYLNTPALFLTSEQLDEAEKEGAFPTTDWRHMDAVVLSWRHH